MILNTRRNSSPSLAKGRLASVVSATALIAVLALYSGPRFVLAQTALKPPTALIATTTASAIAEPAVALSVGQPLTPKLATAPMLLAADAPSAAGVDPGPKFKPEPPGSEPPEPAEVVTSEVPAVPSIDAASMPTPTPRVARVGKPGKAPRPPESPDPMNSGDGSIEERLQRLEKMVQSLMEQQGARHARANLYFKDGADQNFNIDQQQLDKLKSSAERQAARAAELAQRSAEQSKRSLKDLEARLEQQQGNGESREAFQRQIEALRKARESLGQEMERLDRQIEKLEQERQRGEKDQKRRSETLGQKLQAQVSWPEAPAR